MSVPSALRAPAPVNQVLGSLQAAGVATRSAEKIEQKLVVESHLKRSFLVAFSVALIAICNPANAQSYEFRHGYIFEQRYVERVSISQAEKLANIKRLFEPLMSFNWTKEKELIKDQRVKRIGNCLVLAFSAKADLSLKNFSTTQGDGELQTFKYIKSIPGYHIIGVEYGHDQPQFLLVPEQGGHVYFVNTN